MSVQALGMRAYGEAVRHFNKVEGSLQQGTPVKGQTLFARTLDQTLLRDTVDRGPDFGAQADFIKYPTTVNTPITHPTSFTDTVKASLNRVNTLDAAKNTAIEDFASGRNQNVHELMITMQKSSLAMKLTSAVRNKALEAYKELSKMQF